MIAPQTLLTLRELRSHLTNPKVLAVQAAVALMLGQSGPFGTLAMLPVMPRMIYWTVIVFLTYATGYAVTEFTTIWLYRRKVSRWARVVIAGLAVGFAVGVELYLINAITFEDLPFPNGWVQTFALVMPMALVVVALHEFVGLLIGSRESNAPSPPPLLDRLRLENRGPLVSLSVSDHYVNVVTTKGREMILMRLGDAIRETAPVRGMQVHRSHWVALDQITDARKTGDTAQLKTSQGDEIPVSRSYVKALRETGLLPVAATSAVNNG